jgi:hypothetical protein
VREVAAKAKGERLMPIRPEFRHFYRGPAWKATRARICARAKDRCERCHAPNHAIGYRSFRLGHFVKLIDGQRFPPAMEPDARLIKIQCGCAHLNGVAGDDRDENLAWLCRGCHLRHDMAQHKLTRSMRKDAARPIISEAQA